MAETHQHNGSERTDDEHMDGRPRGADSDEVDPEFGGAGYTEGGQNTGGAQVSPPHPPPNDC